MTSESVWDTLYLERPQSFRRYPNTELLAFLSRLKRGQRVLEVGCGNGSNLWAIAHEGFKAWGLEASRVAVEECYETLGRWRQSAIVMHGDLLEMGHPWIDFDAVVDVECLQHVGGPGVYEKVHSLLGKGGKLFSYHLALTTQQDYEAVFPDCGEARILEDFSHLEPWFHLESLRLVTRTHGPHAITHAAIEAVKV